MLDPRGRLCSPIAHPVMRSQPAHISRDHRVDELPVRSPRQTRKAHKRGASKTCALDRSHPYQLFCLDTL
jgi:hypothetical protein